MLDGKITDRELSEMDNAVATVDTSVLKQSWPEWMA